MANALGRLPSLNGLRVFEVVARHLNFGRAADELGVTQGAVAQQIRGLEAELGLQLFERLPRRLALTGAGLTYIADIRRALEVMAEATAVLRPEPHHLTISVTPSFASKWLIPRLPEFTSAHPEIDLRILASDRLSNFHADAVDLAVRYGKPPFGQEVTAELLFEQTIVAVGSSLLVEKLGLPQDRESLAFYTLLHDSHNFWPQFLDAACPGAAAPPTKNIRFNQTSLALDAAIAGQGLALAAAFFVADDLQSGRLLRLFPTVSLRGGADFYLIHPRKPRHPSSVTAVKTWLAAQALRERGDSFPR